jgi:hypothetical protein
MLVHVKDMAARALLKTDSLSLSPSDHVILAFSLDHQRFNIILYQLTASGSQSQQHQTR